MFLIKLLRCLQRAHLASTPLNSHILRLYDYDDSKPAPLVFDPTA